MLQQHVVPDESAGVSNGPSVFKVHGEVGADATGRRTADVFRRRIDAADIHS